MVNFIFAADYYDSVAAVVNNGIITTNELYSHKANIQSLALEKLETALADKMHITGKSLHDRLLKLQEQVLSSSSVDKSIIDLITQSDIYKNMSAYNMSYILVNKKDAGAVLNLLRQDRSFDSIKSFYPNIKLINLGWHAAYSLPAILYNQITTLHKGEYSNIIHSNNMYVIIRLNDLFDKQETKIITQYHLYSIVVHDYNKILNLYKTLSQFSGNDLLSHFINMTKLNNISNTSGFSGDLGWVDFNATPFGKYLQNVDIGHMSQIIHYQNNWYLILISEKHSFDYYFMLKSNIITQMLLQSAQQELYNVWVHKLQSQSYIKYQSSK